MVDKKTGAYLRRRVYFDAGQKTAALRDHARQQWNSRLPQFVREPVEQVWGYPL